MKPFKQCFFFLVKFLTPSLRIFQRGCQICGDRQTVEEAGGWLMTIGGFKYAESLIGRLLRAMLTLTPFPSPCFKSLFPLHFDSTFNRRTVTHFESWGPALQSLSFSESVSFRSLLHTNPVAWVALFSPQPSKSSSSPGPFPLPFAIFESPTQICEYVSIHWFRLCAPRLRFAWQLIQGLNCAPSAVLVAELDCITNTAVLPALIII